MTNLFLSVLEISIAVGFIVFALVLLAPLINKRYAAKWKYWVWMFLALRLLFPFHVSDVQSALDMLGQAAGPAESQPREKAEDVLPDVNMPAQRIIVEIPRQMTEPVAMQSEESGAGVTLLDMAAFVWLMGSVVFMAFHMYCYQRYKGQAIKKGAWREDSRVTSPLIYLSNELQIKRRLPMIEYSGAASPMIIGFVKPMLVLPKEQYSEEELFFILKHELVHLKRGDVYFKLLLVAANAVHWFNPLIWIMQREAVVDMELSCDERVVQGMGYSVRKAYTETLLSTLHKGCSGKTVLSTQFYGGKRIMKKRFKNILLSAKKRNGFILLACAVVLTAVFGTLTGCSVAPSKQDASALASAQDAEGSGAASGQDASAQGQAAGDIADIVRESAEELVAGWYASAQADFADYHYSDWRITSLEHCHAYEDFDGMALQVYQMNFEYLSDAPDNVILAGGMTMTEDGWVMPDYPDSRFLVFGQDGEELSFLACMFENDCFPGDEAFDQDLRLQLEELAASGLSERGAGENTAASFTVFREGEREELPATLYAGDGYSIYLPDDSWQQYAPDAWLAVVEGNIVFEGRIQLWIAHSRGRSLGQVQEERAAEGYKAHDRGLEKRDSGMVYRVSLYESGEDVWEVYQCFPDESAIEEGWGHILSAMADTFAVSAPGGTEQAQGGIWTYSVSRGAAGASVLDFATGMQIILPEEWNGRVAAEIEPGLGDEYGTLAVCEKSNMEANVGGVLFYLYYVDRSEFTEEPYEIWGGGISKVCGVYRQGNREYALIFELPREMNYVEGSAEMQKAYEEVSAFVDKVQIVTGNMSGFTECGVDDLDWIVEG